MLLRGALPGRVEGRGCSWEGSSILKGLCTLFVAILQRSVPQVLRTSLYIPKQLLPSQQFSVPAPCQTSSELE